MLSYNLLTGSEQENQQAYQQNIAREQHCAEWLKTLKNKVSRQINAVALIGIVNGILLIFQSALLAIVFQQLIIEKQDWHELISLFVILMLVFLFRSICSYFFQTLGFDVALRVKRSVRQQLLDKMARLGPAYTKQQQSGALAASTLEHTEALENYFSRYLEQQRIVSILPLLMILAVFPVNWVVAVIFLITGPLVPVFMALVGMGAASANRHQFLALARMSGYFLDRIQGLATLKLFEQANAEVYRIEQVATGFREKTMAVLRIAFLSSAVLEFFSAVAVALVAVYTGLGLLGLIHFGPAENITLEQALFVLLLAPEFFNPLKQLAVYYHDKAAAVGAADHILQILEQEEKTAAVENSQESDFVIVFNNVSKCYQQKQVLKSFDLQIKVGEKIALAGESGVGKSTLIQFLLAFEPVSSGEILINGSPVNRQIVENNIAWVGQQPAVFYASISDNISLANSYVSAKQIEEAADQAGVTAFSRQLKNGMQTLVGEQGYGLSGGQIQRIALARAFVKNAPIIILDEPTAHLDEINKAALLAIIEHLFKDKTLIIASHDQEVLDSMDRVVNLS